MAEYFTLHGLRIDAHEVHGLFVGGTLRTAGEEAARRGATLPEDWFDDLSARVFARLSEGVDLIPGVVDLIDRAEAAGLAVAVASNGAMRKMEITLTPHGLHERLRGRLLSGYEHGAPKPAPDMLLRAAREAGTTPDRAVMVDDSPAGCAAARAAGMRCFGYATGGQGPRLAAQGAEVVDDMAEIARRLGI